MAELTDVHEKVGVAHPAGGERIMIDVELAPVVERMWSLGYATLLSYQDLGEAIGGGGTTTGPAYVERGVVQWSGFAWIKMPLEEAMTFLAFATTLPGYEPSRADRNPPGWEALTWLRPGRTVSYGNIYIPRTQIPDLAEALTSAQPLRE